MADTPARSTTTTISLNVNYVTSLPGLLRLGEILAGFLTWLLISVVGFTPWSPPHQFVMFVAVTSWVLTLILFLIYLCGLHASALSGAPWGIIEFFFNAFWAFFYVIAAIVNAAYTHRNGALAASAAFGFLTAILYCIHAFICFKSWRGNCTCTVTSSSNSETRVNA